MVAKIRSSSSFSFFSISFIAASYPTPTFPSLGLSSSCDGPLPPQPSLSIYSSSRTFRSASLSLNNKIFSMDNSCILRLHNHVMLILPSSFPLLPHLSSWDAFLWSYSVESSAHCVLQCPAPCSFLIALPLVVVHVGNL
jgi:hypothetical protein